MRVVDDAVGAPDTLLHPSALEIRLRCLRNRGCRSWGDARDWGVSGTELPSEEVIEAGRKERRGSFGGGGRQGLLAGTGMGGSACFVCSYRRPISSVSSLKGLRTGACFALNRILLDLWRAIAQDFVFPNGKPRS